jgi:hypothetical protein
LLIRKQTLTLDHETITNTHISAADRFALLPNNDDFVFDFNKKQEGAGKGGMLIAANRKTFPALVGTGSGMAFGTVDRKYLLIPSLHTSTLTHLF